jgi:hypothetical protein
VPARGFFDQPAGPSQSCSLAALNATLAITHAAIKNLWQSRPKIISQLGNKQFGRKRQLKYPHASSVSIVGGKEDRHRRCRDTSVSGCDLPE